MIELRVKAGLAAAQSLTAIKMLATEYSGEHKLTLLIEHKTAVGGTGQATQTRRLELGPLWRYDASPACLARLGEFGDVSVEGDT